MKKSVYLITTFALLLVPAMQGQRMQKPDPAAQEAALEAKKQYIGLISPDTTTTCSYTFTSGTGNTYMKYCVTKNGNVVQFESPLGEEFIATAPIGEGYAFCDYGSTNKEYFDYAGYGDSGNWKAPVTVSSSAQKVVISRETSDGLFTLTQTITQNAANSFVRVTMALKNNSTTLRHVGLLRYADVDAQGFTSNSFDYTYRTAFGYNNMGYGLLQRHYSGATLNGGFAQVIPGGPNPCQIFANVSGGPVQGIDGSIFIEYDMEVAAGTTKTVALDYKSF
jgi:hypothetical protein